MIKSNYHHGDLADALISATVSLLKTKGVAALSLREVARVAGVSHSAPAHHFKDKAGLLTAVAIEGHRLLTKALLDKTMVENQNAAARYRAAGEAYIQFAIAQPAHFEIMFRLELLNKEDVVFQQTAQKARDILALSIREVLDKDALNSDVVESMVISSWSQVHGFAVLWLAGNFGDPGDKVLFEHLLNDLLNSVKFAQSLETRL
jgi:AcrR family transcriptional regulator